MKFSPGSKAICTAIVALAASSVFASAKVQTFDQAKERADQGDAFAQAVVALHYQLGWNTQKSPELAAKYALTSADLKKTGNSPAYDFVPACSRDESHGRWNCRVSKVCGRSLETTGEISKLLF